MKFPIELFCNLDRVKLQAYKQKVQEEKQLDAISKGRTQLNQSDDQFANEITAVLGSIDNLLLADKENRWALFPHVLVVSDTRSGLGKSQNVSLGNL